MVGLSLSSFSTLLPSFTTLQTRYFGLPCLRRLNVNTRNKPECISRSSIVSGIGTILLFDHCPAFLSPMLHVSFSKSFVVTQINYCNRNFIFSDTSFPEEQLKDKPTSRQRHSVQASRVAE